MLGKYKSKYCNQANIEHTLWSLLLFTLSIFGNTFIHSSSTYHIDIIFSSIYIYYLLYK